MNMGSTNDHERFMRLFLENEPQILRAVMTYVPQRGDARDIVQDTAVALWDHFQEYDAERPFANWAIGYARIFVRRYFRSVKRRVSLTEKAAEALLIEAEARDATREQREMALAQCLQELPAQGRSLIEGYYFAEQSIPALAANQGRTVDAVYKTMQRLRQILFHCINSKLTEPTT